MVRPFYIKKSYLGPEKSAHNSGMVLISSGPNNGTSLYTCSLKMILKAWHYHKAIKRHTTVFNINSFVPKLICEFIQCHLYNIFEKIMSENVTTTLKKN